MDGWAECSVQFIICPRQICNPEFGVQSIKIKTTSDEPPHSFTRNPLQNPFFCGFGMGRFKAVLIIDAEWLHPTVTHDHTAQIGGG